MLGDSGFFFFRHLKIWWLRGPVIVSSNNPAEKDEGIFPELSSALGKSHKMAALLSRSEKDAGKKFAKRC